MSSPPAVMWRRSPRGAERRTLGIPAHRCPGTQAQGVCRCQAAAGAGRSASAGATPTASRTPGIHDNSCRHTCHGGTVPFLLNCGSARRPFGQSQQVELLEIFIPVTL